MGERQRTAVSIARKTISSRMGELRHRSLGDGVRPTTNSRSLLGRPKGYNFPANWLPGDP